MSESNSIINALKRLERAGSENSRATEKLREAVEVVSLHVGELLPLDMDWGEILPRGYEPYNHAGKTGVYSGRGVGPREAALDFARDVATGWLDELAAWLEKRAEEAYAAAYAAAAATTLDKSFLGRTAEGERG